MPAGAVTLTPFVVALLVMTFVAFDALLPRRGINVVEVRRRRDREDS